MDLKSADICKIIEACKNSSVTKFSYDKITIELSPSAQNPYQIPIEGHHPLLHGEPESALAESFPDEAKLEPKAKYPKIDIVTQEHLDELERQGLYSENFLEYEKKLANAREGN